MFDAAPDTDAAPLTIEAQARDLLERLLAKGDPVALRLAAGGRVALLLLTDDLPERLTRCEQDLMATITAAPPGRRVKTDEFLSLLDRAGMLHGESTVKHALARLVREGWLVSYRRGGSGYTAGPLMAKNADDTNTNPLA